MKVPGSTDAKTKHPSKFFGCRLSVSRVASGTSAAEREERGGRRTGLHATSHDMAHRMTYTDVETWSKLSESPPRDPQVLPPANFTRSPPRADELASFEVPQPIFPERPASPISYETLEEPLGPGKRNTSNASGVEIIGHSLIGERRSATTTGCGGGAEGAVIGSHRAYDILTVSNMHDKENAQACRLVQRRYSEFVILREALQPVARRRGLTLPPLPSKVWALGRGLSPRLANGRQQALQAWLAWVVAQSPLWQSVRLRVFLGLAQSRDEATETASSRRNSSQDSSMRSADENACIDALIDAATECRRGHVGFKRVVTIDSCEEEALEAAFERADALALARAGSVCAGAN